VHGVGTPPSRFGPQELQEYILGVPYIIIITVVYPHGKTFVGPGNIPGDLGCERRLGLSFSDEELFEALDEMEVISAAGRKVDITHPGVFSTI
jgi:hypothetical protein